MYNFKTLRCDDLASGVGDLYATQNVVDDTTRKQHREQKRRESSKGTCGSVVVSKAKRNTVRDVKRVCDCLLLCSRRFASNVRSASHTQNHHENPKTPRFAMRTALIILSLCCLVYCFSQQEIEIFQLQQHLHEKYGAEMNFYKFLKLTPDATHAQIVKQFKSLTRKYHPDKNKGKYKKLFANVQLVSNILKDASAKKTYDFYLAKGFPKYKVNKGYAFNKAAAPMLLIFGVIFLLIGLCHYAMLVLQNNANKKRIASFIEMVKREDTTNGMGEVQLMLNDTKKILVSYGQVYVVQDNGAKDKVTLEGIVDPTFKDSLFFTLPKWVYAKVTGGSKASTKTKSN